MFSTDLNPVQVMFLHNPSKMHIEDALSIILRDLTLKRVLNMTKLNIYPTERSKKTQKYFKFVKGEKFEGYEPEPHEKNFLVPFEEVDLLQPKSLTNFVLRRFSMPSGFITEKIYGPLHVEGYVTGLPLLKTFGYYSLSRKGKEVVEMFNQFISEQEQKLESLIDGDKTEFTQALQETGVYTFYFEKNNPELFKNIISMIKRVNNNFREGANNDLTSFAEAVNIDLGYFGE